MFVKKSDLKVECPMQGNKSIWKFLRILNPRLGNHIYVLFQDLAWGDHWDEATGDKLELNPHIPKPDPPKEEEKKEEEKEGEEKKKEEEEEEKKEDGEKVNF